MKPERWKEVDRLLDAALELDAEKRAAFLNEACAGDDALRKEVESLLDSDAQARSFIESPVSELGAELLAGNVTRLVPGEMIGPYEIISPLGKGGMGEVFRARDTRLDRDVAIKILAGSLSNDAAAMSRFAREAKALAALSHSNIIAIHDFGTDLGISYAVMELLKGQTLREKLSSSKKLSITETLEIATGIANGLTAAHSAHVIHRDLKPENIFLTTDRGVKILDFGLARREVPTTTQEQTSAATISQSEVGVVLGTVPYMSPEQVRAEKVDARTDIFSFGAVLFEMVSGERLFARKTSADTVSAILNDNPPKLAESAEMNQIIQHCLEKNPDQRFQTARDLLFALKSVSSGSEISVARPTAVAKRTVVTSLIALVILLAIAGSYYLWITRGNATASIAIMPFLNVSGNAGGEYLSDGITDSIIYNLSNLPNLRIMGRDTVFTYKGKQIDPRKIGRELNVQAVVTGTVDQQGDMLVIRANLINVADGIQIWGDQYNQTLADVLKIQSQISQQISEKLKVKLSGEQKKLVAKLYTDNPEAYRLYLKGEYHIWKNTEEDYEQARQYFQKALDLDPTYALAHHGMALFYTAVGLEGLWPPDEAWPKAEAARKTALQLEPDMSFKSVALPLIEYLYRWNWEAGDRAFEQSEKGSGTSYVSHAFCLLAVGRVNDAIEKGKKAIQVDPLSRVVSVNYGQVLASAGNYDEAIGQLKKTIRLDPNFDAPHFSLAQIYENKGMIREAIAETIEAYRMQGSEDAAELFKEAKDAKAYQEAKKTIARDNLESLTELAKQKYVSALEFARLHAKLNEKDEAFQWLEKAYKERSSQLIFIRVLDDFKTLRSDPRFDDLVKRIGLPS